MLAACCILHPESSDHMRRVLTLQARRANHSPYLSWTMRFFARELTFFIKGGSRSTLEGQTCCAKLALLPPTKAEDPRCSEEFTNAAKCSLPSLAGLAGRVVQQSQAGLHHGKREEHVSAGEHLHAG